MHIVSALVSLVVFLLSTASSSVAIWQYTEHRSAILVVFMVAGFLLAVLSILAMLIRPNLPCGVAISISTVFYLATGITLTINLVTGTGWPYCEVLVAIFMVNMVCVSAWTTSQILSLNKTEELPYDNTFKDTYTKDVDRLQDTSFRKVLKKSSDQTLINEEMPKEVYGGAVVSQSYETLQDSWMSQNTIKMNKNSRYSQYAARAISSSNRKLSSSKSGRAEPWKSEKVFISNVNQSLLPSVLKTGESQIMASKRLQSRVEDATSSDDERHLSPVGEHSQFTPSPSPYNPILLGGSNRDTIDFDDQDIEMHDITELSDFNEADLPYVNEFAETVNQSHFTDFDQHYVLPKKKKEYKFTDMNYDEPYGKALDTLEKIPSVARKVSWMTPKQEDGPRINSISLKEWDQNSQLYQEIRKRSGNLGNNFLLPPVERADNLDDISDIRSDGGEDLDDVSREPGSHPSPTEDHSPRGVFPKDTLSPNSYYRSTDITESFTGNNEIRIPTYSSRSHSAPSLHTFRNVSQNNSAHLSIEDSIISKNSNKLGANQRVYILPLAACKTPGEDVATSPVKKFFQESPKRLTSVFKRARQSLDESEPKFPDFAHKHSSSMYSNQVSIPSSFDSSKSGSVVASGNTSPRKSLKSFLSKHKYSNSMPSFNGDTMRGATGSTPSVNAMMKTMHPAYKFHHDSALRMAPQPIADIADFWDLDTANSSEQSRVSSAPSDVVGEYDREKWRTLKALKEQETFIE